ncbi:MAG: hypothetical protein ACK5GN_10745 [Pseudomonadota bacterium]|jgi:hypothetical protein
MSLEPEELNKNVSDFRCSTSQPIKHNIKGLKWWPNSPGALSELGAPRQVELDLNQVGETKESVFRGESVLWRSRPARFIATALTSNNTYSMIGNLTIAAHLQLGIYFQMACAGLAVWNEMREREVGESNVEQPYQRSWGHLIKAFVLSPGIYRYSLSVAFIANAIEHGYSSILGLNTAFVFLAAGNLCVANDMSKSYFERIGIKRDSRSSKRPTARLLWMSALLANGAVYWGIADVLVGLDGLHRAGLDLLISPPLFTVGVASAMVSVASVLVVSRRNPNSPWPFALNAATNYLFGLANFLYVPGAQAAAVAVSMWGTGSVLIALDKYKTSKRGKRV